MRDLNTIISVFKNAKISQLTIEQFNMATKLFQNDPFVYSKLVTQNPQLSIVVDEFFDNQISKELAKIPKNANLQSYTAEVTKNVQKLASQQLSMAYAQPIETDRLYRNQGLLDESIITMSKSVPIYDYESGNITTLNSAAKKTITQNSLLKKTDFAKDPVRAGLMLYLDSDYLFYAPIIPISDSKMISLEEYCKVELNDDKCKKTKNLVKIVNMASKSGDKKLFNSSAKLLLQTLKEF